jgi:hypothetical protein
MSSVWRKALESKLDGRHIIAARLCVEREFAAEEDRQGFESISAEVGAIQVADAEDGFYRIREFTR